MSTHSLFHHCAYVFVHRHAVDKAGSYSGSLLSYHAQTRLRKFINTDTMHVYTHIKHLLLNQQDWVTVHLIQAMRFLHKAFQHDYSWWKCCVYQCNGSTRTSLVPRPSLCYMKIILVQINTHALYFLECQICDEGEGLGMRLHLDSAYYYILLYRTHQHSRCSTQLLELHVYSRDKINSVTRNSHYHVFIFRGERNWIVGTPEWSDHSSTSRT